METSVLSQGMERVQPSGSATAIRFQHDPELGGLLESLGLSLLISTYQAGKVILLGSHGGKVQVRFHHFDQAMGLARTESGLAIGSRNEVWFLKAVSSLSRKIEPVDQFDGCFLTQGCHYTGPIMGHEMASAGGRLWLVNTLFSCLCVLQPDFHFESVWQPPFVSELVAEDRCHLNGLGMKDHAPAFLTALGRTNTPGGWREKKANGGILIHLPSSQVICGDLCMPHSPRWHGGQLWVLNSGQGTLCLVDPSSGKLTDVVSLPGYARGLDFHGKFAFVGLARIRETSVFGGLPISQRKDDLKCGVAVVDLEQGSLVGFLFFQNGVEEIFEVKVLPGFRNPYIGGPKPESDGLSPVWLTSRNQENQLAFAKG